MFTAGDKNERMRRERTGEHETLMIFSHSEDNRRRGRHAVEDKIREHQDIRNGGGRFRDDYDRRDRFDRFDDRGRGGGDRYHDRRDRSRSRERDDYRRDDRGFDRRRDDRDYERRRDDRGSDRRRDDRDYERRRDDRDFERRRDDRDYGGRW